MNNLKFDLLRSKTMWGTLLAAIAYLSSPEVLAILPPKWAAVVTTIGGLLAAIGVRDAIAGNGVASTPEAATRQNSGDAEALKVREENL